MARIAVFCGASTGHHPRYAQLAAEVGRVVAERGFGLVYGGGHVGLMGILADAAMKAGGEVIGVIPRFMEKAELAHRGVTQLILVGSMHERKQRMHELSDAVIALPGGFGTMDELFELLTWRQIGLHDKPIGLLNAFGFYDALLQQTERMREEGFLHGDTRMLVDPGVKELLDLLFAQHVDDRTLITTLCPQWPFGFACVQVPHVPVIGGPARALSNEPSSAASRVSR